MNGNNTNLSGIELAAALAEEIYRRADGDNPIDVVGDLGATPIDMRPFLEDASGLHFNSNATPENQDYYFYSSKGFVGRVVEKDGVVYVVFRGTDEASSFPVGFGKMVYNGGLSNPTVKDPSEYISDLGDWSSNYHLGKGTLQATQLDDALALTQAAKAYAQQNGLAVQVVGQSLGGGLAGLVATLEDIPGYVIAPAPFDNQIKVEATLNVLKEFGITKQQAAAWTTGQLGGNEPPTEMNISSAFKNGGIQLAAVLRYNMPQLSETDIQKILSDKQHAETNLIGNLISNVYKHTIIGEVLSDGSGSLSEYFGYTGASRFGTDPGKTVSYDLGVDPGLFTNSTTTVSLHGSALHNLVIRTDNFIRYGDGGKFQRFSELLQNNEFMRHALLEQTAISAPIGGDRKDPHEDAYGGSGVKSSTAGADSAIIFRTLWKSVGIEDGFYDKFYTAFSLNLSSEAIQNEELRKGLTFLGLQVIRDGLRDDSGNVVLSEIAANPYELSGLKNGAGVDLNNIDGSIVNGKISDNVFGYLEANDGLKETLRTYLNATQLDQHGLKINLDLTAWRTLIHGNNVGSLIYITEETRKGSSHAIIGSTGDDFIVASNSNDIIMAKSGNNDIVAGSGDDYIIGGTGDDVIFGEDGNDTIVGGFGYNQFINGGKGDDYLVAVGAGKYYGAEGDDIFIAKQYYSSSGIRYMDGGSGYDIAYLDNLLLLDTREVTIDGFTKYGFSQGPSQPWQIELFKYGSTHFRDIEEFRVGWNFDYTSETWSAGSNSQTFSKDDLYRYLLTGSNTQAENFKNATYAVVSAENFDKPGQIVLFKGTIMGESDEYILSLGNYHVVEIGNHVFPLKADINGKFITIYIETSEKISFDSDTRISGILKLEAKYIGSDGEVYYAWNGSRYIFESVVSTSLPANPQPLPLKDIGANGILASQNGTFTGIIFNVDHHHSNDSIEWRISSAHSDGFYILPNGELHSLTPIFIGLGSIINLTVTAISGDEEFTKKFAITDSGVVNNLIEGTDANDVIYDTNGGDIIFGGGGDDLIVTSGGLDNVMAGDGNDTILISATGNYYGEAGDDVFDLSNVDVSKSGSISGGDGYDIIYTSGIDDLYFQIINGYLHFTVNNYSVYNIEEFRYGWNYNTESNTFIESSSSSSFTLEQFLNMGLAGKITGINSDWGSVYSSVVNEQRPSSFGNISIFSGMLTGAYDYSEIHSIEMWLDGQPVDATFSVNDGTIDVMVDKAVLQNLPYSSFFSGKIYFYNSTSSGVESITFGGKVLDTYSEYINVEGTAGYDIFDMTDSNFSLSTGSIDGGEGHDILYLDDIASIKFEVSKINSSLKEFLSIKGFEISNIEEFRIGWLKDHNGVWYQDENSIIMSYDEVIENALFGVFGGINTSWKNISVATVDESLQQVINDVVVFQGELKLPVPSSIIVEKAFVKINGQDFLATIIENNGIYTIMVPKAVIFDVGKNTAFEGTIYSSNQDGVLTSYVNFYGLIKDVYDLQNAPTEIIGNSVIDPTGTDTFDSVQFSVDHFNHDKPITWTISGSGSELFSISNDGVLSSIGVIDLSVPYDFTIQATDGVKTVVKNIYINPYNPINTIFGTSGDDILYGTAQDDIIHGLEGDDTIYVGGGFDTVYGGAGNDTIIASDNYVDLYGEDGNDTLIGSVQDDYLYGGDGDDIIYGGGHKDRMWGGSGADVFVYKNVTDSDYENLDLSDRIFDLEDIDSFDFTEMGDVSFDWDNGPAGSLYVEVNWQPARNYGYLSIDVDRDGVFDMAIDFDVGAAGLTQINFVNGPTYYLDSGAGSSSVINSDDLLVKPIADNSPETSDFYQWAA